MNIISFLFCTYDRASQAFSPPFAAPHAGVAIRGFTDAINNPNRDTDISKHPDDFDLHEVGTFNASTGEVLPADNWKKPIIQGKQVALLQLRSKEDSERSSRQSDLELDHL